MSESFKILVVDDESEYREVFRILLESRGYHVGEATCAKEALDMLYEEYYPLILSDLIMPGMDGLELLKKIKNMYGKSTEVIMVTGYGSIENAVEAIKLGAFGYFIKSHNPEELLIEIDKAKNMIKLHNQKEFLKSSIEKKKFIEKSKNPKMIQVIDTINVVAKSRINVLLTGESGVGKEVMAQMIHDNSDRNSMPFVPINCQAFSDNLLESELFGHEKGAFTGAIEKRIGRFEEANGGTIFLDEIGEMSLSTQTKLLRVLENKTIERVGSSKPINVNFRLICATNKTLEDEIRHKNFREDLYYRINTIKIEIPPLRDRIEDLPEMIGFFLNMFSQEMKKEINHIENRVMDYLLNYSYPGNIRELKNTIERIVVLSREGVISEGCLPERGKNNEKKAYTFKLKPYKEMKREFEADYFKMVLSENNNNITLASKAIGISRRQFFNKISEYNLKEDVE